MYRGVGALPWLIKREGEGKIEREEKKDKVGDSGGIMSLVV
jgi:hypothetical protein